MLPGAGGLQGERRDRIRGGHVFSCGPCSLVDPTAFPFPSAYFVQDVRISDLPLHSMVFEYAVAAADRQSLLKRIEVGAQCSGPPFGGEFTTEILRRYSEDTDRCSENIHHSGSAVPAVPIPLIGSNVWPIGRARFLTHVWNYGVVTDHTALLCCESEVESAPMCESAPTFVCTPSGVVHDLLYTPLHVIPLLIPLLLHRQKRSPWPRQRNCWKLKSPSYRSPWTGMRRGAGRGQVEETEQPRQEGLPRPKGAGGG